MFQTLQCDSLTLELYVTVHIQLRVDPGTGQQASLPRDEQAKVFLQTLISMRLGSYILWHYAAKRKKREH